MVSRQQCYWGGCLFRYQRIIDLLAITGGGKQVRADQPEAILYPAGVSDSAAVDFLIDLCGVISNFRVIPLATKQWLSSLLFCRNYSFFSQVQGTSDWYTGHLWSLAVEEHFYLLLPGLLLALQPRWRVRVLVAIALAVETWRVYEQQTRPWMFLFQHTDIRLDALLVPAICAILLTERRWLRILAVVARFWPATAALTIYLVTTNHFPIVGRLAESFLIPLVLLGTVLYPRSIAGRFLELPLLRWVGRLSYSLYLWQQMFFTGHCFAPLGRWQQLPVSWILLFACAAASYYRVERPLMRRGHRLAPPATPGRGDLEPASLVASGTE